MQENNDNQANQQTQFNHDTARDPVDSINDDALINPEPVPETVRPVASQVESTQVDQPIPNHEPESGQPVMLIYHIFDS